MKPAPEARLLAFGEVLRRYQAACPARVAGRTTVKDWLARLRLRCHGSPHKRLWRAGDIEAALRLTFPPEPQLLRAADIFALARTADRRRRA